MCDIKPGVLLIPVLQSAELCPFIFVTNRNCVLTGSPPARPIRPASLQTTSSPDTEWWWRNASASCSPSSPDLFCRRERGKDWWTDGHQDQEMEGWWWRQDCKATSKRLKHQPQIKQTVHSLDINCHWCGWRMFFFFYFTRQKLLTFV